ncbi:RCS-specific HTH-type transcriptional activator RclR [Xylophilus ampelinus]|nr:RCS-specific HTH-type transcriptional activator RclR [Xylophilus ampelinus]
MNNRKAVFPIRSYSLDPLSDVLSMLRVRSTATTRFEGRGRWAMSFRPYESHLKFGCVLSGSFLLQMDGARDAVRLDEGDFYLLLNGAPFSTFATASDLHGPRRSGSEVYRSHRDSDGVVRFAGRQGRAGAAVPHVALASARFVFEGEATELLLRHLPPMLHLRAGAAAARPLAGLLHLLRLELEAPHAGGALARTHLGGLLLIQMLRAHLSSADMPLGWLQALADPRISAALAAAHADIARPWTLDELAGQAHMSRTAFAVRFKALVGMTAVDYLTHWRMAVARDALRRGGENIARIAERVGYQSETAFSAAFKRSTGDSPGRYRARQQAVA